ncbi:nucleolin-like [Dendropsophus ebraccatus]|uniref:nucleolin-like n=1 Tax=Dendropsophus ebraccatus TaxID=150705 RepID=UPI00383215DD
MAESDRPQNRVYGTGGDAFQREWPNPRDDKYPLYSWVPSLETIVETDEDEEDNAAADIPWSEDDTEEDSEDWDSEEDTDDEDEDDWEWKMDVMEAPWIFRDDKYPLHGWIPSLETIVETDEEEEADEAEDNSSEIDDDEEEDEAADPPREEEEDDEDQGTTMEIPR